MHSFVKKSKVSFQVLKLARSTHTHTLILERTQTQLHIFLTHTQGTHTHSHTISHSFSHSLCRSHSSKHFKIHILSECQVKAMHCNLAILGPYFGRGSFFLENILMRKLMLFTTTGLMNVCLFCTLLK